MGYSNHPVCMCVCVCYQLISETTRFCYLDKLLMDRMGCESLDSQRLCCKDKAVLMALLYFSILNH